ncbi:MAG: cytochrome c [Bacteroidia bacterium]|nr:cytochrome c [Bacteroidia bacterium]
MDTGILHTHHLLGVLLLVLVGAPIVLPTWADRLKKVHMILDTLLLLTGIYLLWKAPLALSAPYILKYILVIGAIGLAVAGSRKRNKKLSMAAFLLLAYGYGLSLQRDFFLRSDAARVASLAREEVSLEAGAELYRTLCARCHGPEGRAGYRKSASLHPAQQTDTSYWAAVIRAGKGVMPAHGYLTEAQISSLILYLKGWQ